MKQAKVQFQMLRLLRLENILRVKQNLNRILSENTGKPIDVVSEACERDNFMSAEEAKEFGLIDAVISKR